MNDDVINGCCAKTNNEFTIVNMKNIYPNVDTHKPLVFEFI